MTGAGMTGYETGGALRRTLRARDGLMLGALDWPGDPARRPLLCLPGISRTALDYVAVAGRQRGARRVVALDHAGHGLSARPEEVARYGVGAAITDVLDAMAALHLHRVVLLGTSFGGILGMAIGVLRPACLAAVVLNDIGPRMEPGGLELVHDFIGRDPALATEEDAVAFVQARMPPMALDAEGWRRMARRTYAPGPDGRLHPRWDPRIVQRFGGEAGTVADLWPAFNALAHLPLLLVHGALSALLSDVTVAAMRRARRDMMVATVPGVGHAPTLEEPAAVAGLERFLARIG
ncbi:MAG: alpha/beta hydrolase [Acetobacteraceae bacterium]|nr:alpha/beta hydrolase [Acetobacteraceae bacterium]